MDIVLYIKICSLILATGQEVCSVSNTQELGYDPYKSKNDCVSEFNHVIESTLPYFKANGIQISALSFECKSTSES